MAHAAARPRAVAVRRGNRMRRYDELARDVEWAAASLTARGTRAGGLVVLDLVDPIETLTGLLAADLIGATPLVCDPSWGSEHRTAVLRSIPAHVHVEALASVGGTAQPHAAAPGDLAWAGFTSGSTGRPRVVVRTRGSWTGSYDAVSRLTATTPSDSVLVPGPLASSLYAFAALHTLAVGATLIVTPGWSPSELRRCLPYADVVHLVPHALDAVLTSLESAGRGRLRTAVVGGAALPAGWRARAAAVGVDVVAYYGAAELSFVAVDVDGAGLRAFPGVEIDVRPLSGSAVGEVWVRSAWVAHGYLADRTGPLRRDGSGWATVGDLADRGMPLVLRGRGDGAVLTGGATVVPEDVESVLAAVPGVVGVVVVGTGHERLGSVVTAVVESGRVRVPRSSLEAAARVALAPAQRPRRWLAVDALPRTSSGKPARALISTDLATGALPTWPMT